MKKYILYLFLLFVYACASGVKDSVQTFKVDPGHLSDKPFHEFFSLEEIIPLEATDSSAFSEILKVVAVKDRIFILPWAADKILSFSREGKFIRSLDRKGRAPGEYQVIKDFVVTKDPEQLIVYDLLGKLIYYDWEGSFIREEKRDSYLSGLEYLPNGKWLVNHAMWPTSKINDTAYIFRIADAEGKYLKGAFKLPELLTPVPTMPSALFQDREYSYIAPLTQNIIYRYDSQKDILLPAFSFDIKNHPVPAEPIRKNDRQPFFYDYYFLNCEYIGKKTVVVSAYCLAKTELLTLVCDQKEGNAYPFPYIWEDKANELTLQRYFQQTGFDGNLLTFTRPMQVLDRKYQDKDSPGHKLSQKVTEEDNPILLVYKEN